MESFFLLYFLWWENVNLFTTSLLCTVLPQALFVDPIKLLSNDLHLWVQVSVHQPVIITELNSVAWDIINKAWQHTYHRFQFSNFFLNLICVFLIFHFRFFALFIIDPLFASYKFQPIFPLVNPVRKFAISANWHVKIILPAKCIFLLNSVKTASISGDWLLIEIFVAIFNILLLPSPFIDNHMVQLPWQQGGWLSAELLI